MDLPEPIRGALAPLFERLPLNEAMSRLTPRGGADPELRALAEAAAAHPEIAARPALGAGIWLYVDELDRSHDFSQRMDCATGAFWHGIMHRREGDFSNSHYWFRRAGRHPAMDALPGYDAHAFIDEVARRRQEDPPELAARQREEWAALFAWCAAQRE